jgi:hypothetical protein
MSAGLLAASVMAHLLRHHLAGGNAAAQANTTANAGHGPASFFLLPSSFFLLTTYFLLFTIFFPVRLLARRRKAKCKKMQNAAAAPAKSGNRLGGSGGSPGRELLLSGRYRLSAGAAGCV